MGTTPPVNRGKTAGHQGITRVFLAALIVIASAIWVGAVLMQNDEQMSFRSPEEAAQALADACSANDVSRLIAILGPAGRILISSGDEVADRASRELLARAYGQKHRLVPETAGKQILYLGVEDWPVPVPIIRQGDTWRFETIIGREDLLRRRIDANESSALSVCRLYVELQNQYAQIFYDRNNFAGLYAQKFMSDPDKQNGLYWDMKGRGRRSPADALVQLATQEGYSGPNSHPRPFHGYYFKILTAQGKDASGGQMSYFDTSDTGLLSERKMTRGFALVSYPAKYRASGVLSFIVNQNGIVYRKDLGEDTELLAREMTEYNPDPTWERIF